MKTGEATKKLADSGGGEIRPDKGQVCDAPKARDGRGSGGGGICRIGGGGSEGCQRR